MIKLNGTIVGKSFYNKEEVLIVYASDDIRVVCNDGRGIGANCLQNIVIAWEAIHMTKFLSDEWLTDDKEVLSRYIEIINESNQLQKVEKIEYNTESHLHSFEIEDLGKGVHRATYDSIHITNEEATKQLKRIADKLNLEYTTTEVVDKDDKKEDEYSIDNFYEEVMGEWDYEKHFKYSLQYKGALLLISPPGMGKTTIAKALAKLEVGYSKSYRIKIISFSESTDRNNMIDGLKCINGVWQYAKGELMKFFELAAQEPEKPFVLVIDEINRGKTERIFGEIMTCMEDRGKPITTMYGAEIVIPQNVIFIGTMNSYDQSVVSLSAAIKDRFDTLDFQYYKECKVSSKELINFYGLEESSVQAKALDSIMKLVDSINSLLERDLRKGKDNIIGNRLYFTNKYNYKGNKIEINTEWFTRLAREIKTKSLDKASWLSESEQDEIKEYIDDIQSIIDKLEV